MMPHVHLPQTKNDDDQSTEVVTSDDQSPEVRTTGTTTLLATDIIGGSSGGGGSQASSTGVTKGRRADDVTSLTTSRMYVIEHYRVNPKLCVVEVPLLF